MHIPKKPLWQKVILGLLLGIVTGFVMGPYTVYLKPFGDLFLRLIQMIVVPLIFFSIINGLGSIQNAKKLGRIGIKAAGAYILCTMFAIVIGIGSALVFQPGVGLSIPTGVDEKILPFHPLDMLMKIVPENAIGAMANGKILQVVFFSIFCGITLVSMGEKAARIHRAVRELTDFVLAMVRIIVMLSPVAAFCLMAWCVGSQGVEVLFGLSKLVMTGLFAFLAQYLIFGGIIKYIGKLSPIPFYKKSFEYQAMALSTSSTKASLPITMSVCREKLGVSEVSSSFILPLGASINMDGLAIYLGLCVVTFAQAMGHVLSLSDYGVIIFTATLGSIGGAGIPRAAIAMMPIVLSAINLPHEAAIAMILGIDSFMDIFRTTISITGDAAVTLTVDSAEGMHNADIYYDQKQNQNLAA